jgi:hypothetical protein
MNGWSKEETTSGSCNKSTPNVLNLDQIEMLLLEKRDLRFGIAVGGVAGQEIKQDEAKPRLLLLTSLV